MAGGTSYLLTHIQSKAPNLSVGLTKMVGFHLQSVESSGKAWTRNFDLSRFCFNYISGIHMSLDVEYFYVY